MTIAALSPNSVMSTPVQVNPQVKMNLQTSVPQYAQDAQRSAKTAQTDTVTFSAQALKMADDKNAAAKEATRKADEQRTLQLERDKADAAKNAKQRNALKAYSAVAGGR